MKSGHEIAGLGLLSAALLWVAGRKDPIRKNPPVEELDYRPPYDEDGKTSFPESQNRKGVYLIKINGEVRYIGHSKSNLYKTMYRHFQAWQDKTQTRVTYKNKRESADHEIEVGIIYTSTGKQAEDLEKAFILRYEPKDNPNKLKKYQPSEKESADMEKAFQENEKN